MKESGGSVQGGQKFAGGENKRGDVRDFDLGKRTFKECRE